MANQLFRIALMLTITFMLFIGLLRVRPYDSNDLRGLLPMPNNDDCPAPCWRGIRPGITTLEEAAAILYSDTWVQDVFMSPTLVSWAWTGAQPALVDGDHHGVLWARNGVVRQVKISLNVTFGEVWLLLDQPQQGDIQLSGATISRPTIYRAAHLAVYAYPGGVLQTNSVLTCPLNPGAFWNAPVELRLESISRNVEEYDLPNWFHSQQVCAERQNRSLS